MECYRSALWPTRDQVVPVQTFFLFYNAIANVAAAERWEGAQAAAHGQLLAENGKDASVKSMTRRLVRRAFPEVEN